MENVFITLLNLSINASYLIIAVILLRFALFKAPKWINCLLWGAVGLRLAIPLKLESILSLLPSPEPIPQDIALSPTPEINTGIPYVNNAVNPIITESFTPEPTASANPLQILISAAAIVWLIGVGIMLLWGVISYLRLKHRTAPSLLLRDNIYLCDSISSPFILGIFLPRVYLPSSIAESDATHVIAHERAHLARRDHIWKPLGFIILAIYWFNPLCWIAYILFCRDIEKACDEKVIRNMQCDERKEYSSALLSCSTKRFSVSACPLAFGEVGVKSRIKSILNYKKPAFWIIIVSIVLAAGLCIGFLTTPPKTPEIPSIIGNTDTGKMNERQKELFEQFPEYFGLDATNGLDVYVWQMAEGSFSFGVKPHSDEPLGWQSTELYKLRSVGAYDMRLILATYSIERENINIIPWQNPLSSYLGDLWIITDGEDAVKKREKYVALIEDMLFDKVYLDPDNLMYIPSYLGDPYYDTMTFDVDGDGHNENCALGYGYTSGLFSFIFYAQDQSGANRYYTVIYSMAYDDLSFKLCDDGVVRVQAIEKMGGDILNTYLFDIEVKDGEIWLYDQNGQYIGDKFVSPIIYPAS